MAKAEEIAGGLDALLGEPTETLDIETGRWSTFQTSRGPVKVCLDRDPINCSILPTHKGFRVRRSRMSVIDDNTQRIQSDIWFVDDSLGREVASILGREEDVPHI